MNPATRTAVVSRTIAAGAIALALLATLFAVGSPAEAKMKITGRSFGVHSFTTDPGVPAGTLRMSCSPLWRTTQPREGVYRWRTMDDFVARAEGWGFSDIQFVFCGTPEWAASGPVRYPEKEVLGKGSTAAPNRAAFRAFATAVVQRYRGRIDSYQVWNEITTAQFYQGSVKRMVQMTKDLRKVVRRYGGGADVVAASVQTHVPAWFTAVALPYFKGLKKAKWPVDAVAGHFYPPGKGGPNTRVKQIQLFNKVLKRYKLPRSKQRWDTEGNFWTSVPGNPRAGRVRGKKAAAWVARNYLDAWRLGLRRAYWYLWSEEYVPFAGIQLRTGTAATKAYRTFGGWTIGATMGTCKQRGKLVVCPFRKTGDRFSVAFTTKGKAKLKIKGKRSVCPVTGASCRTAKKKVIVRTLPVRIA